MKKGKLLVAANKSKSKGSSWERDIANHLSSIYNESFIRTSGSGAYVGGKNSVRKEFLHEGQIRASKGDIVPPFDWKHFNCEAKNYADLPFHQLFKPTCKQIETWLTQLIDASDEGDLNILIIKITRKGKFVVVSQDYTWDLSIPYLSYHSSDFDKWYIFDYDLFWEYNLNLVKTLSISQKSQK